MRETFANRPTTAADYLAILRRRKWILLLPPIAAGIAAFALSTRQDPVYEATASVLVSRTSVVSAITNVGDPSAGDPVRFLTTQANIARSPELASRVVDKSAVRITPGGLLSESDVQPSDSADLLYFSVRDGDADRATLLANTYAREFTGYKTELDTRRINEALQVVTDRINILRARGETTSSAYETLVQNQGQLETVGKLLANNTSVLKPASGAAKIRPTPTRDAILGVLLGIVVGLSLGLLAESLDRRVRTEHEVDETLGLPLLARIPRPSRRLRRHNALVMLDDPSNAHAETFRKLRTSVEFVNADVGAKTIMVTSAVDREGKSTTIANLAVALARGGRNVALVDLDLRRSMLDRFFHVNPRPGVTDLAIGRASAKDAMRQIPLISPAAAKHPPLNGRRPASRASFNGRASVQGVLQLFPAGTLPPSAGEFLQDTRLTDALHAIAERFDIVLIDAPPLLAVGDAMTLSTDVDAIVVVTRLGRVQRPMLHELARQLRAVRASVLGYVATGAEHGDSYSYMYETYAHDELIARDKQHV
jgi:Mrp family chromosome partitioning ATPase